MPKGNEVLSHEKTWRKLEYILLSEKKNQSEKAAYCVTPGTLGKTKPCRQLKRSVIARDLEETGMNRKSTEDF